MTLDDASRRPSPFPAQVSSYLTAGGIRVERRKEAVDAHLAIEGLIDALDTRRGVLLSSNYDYPGRYTRWDLGLSDPLLEVVSRGRQLQVNALSDRGKLLLAPIARTLEALPELAHASQSPTRLDVTIKDPERRFAE